LNQDQQKLAVVAVHQHATERAEYQTGRCAAQSQYAQRHRGARDFIGDPIERNLLYEMAYGTQQIARPEQRIVSVAQGIKYLYGLGLLPGV